MAKEEEYWWRFTLPNGKRIYPATFRILGPFVIIGGIVVAIKEDLWGGIWLIIFGLAISVIGFAKVVKKV